MKKAIGTVLAMLVTLNAGLVAIPMDDATRALAGVVVGVAIAGVTFWLKDGPIGN